MDIRGETMGETCEELWPTPDDPRFTGASEQTRQHIERTQPEALQATLTRTIREANKAIGSLVLFIDSYPAEAIENALNRLTDGKAELFRQQVDFARSFSEEQSPYRDESLEGRLYELADKAADVLDRQSAE